MSLASLLNLGKKEPEAPQNEPEKSATPATSSTVAPIQEELKLAQELADSQSEAVKEDKEREKADEDARKVIALEVAAKAAQVLAKKQKEAKEAAQVGGNPFSTGGGDFKRGIFVCDTHFGSAKPSGATSIGAVVAQSHAPMAARAAAGVMGAADIVTPRAKFGAIGNGGCFSGDWTASGREWSGASGAGACMGAAWGPPQPAWGPATVSKGDWGGAWKGVAGGCGFGNEWPYGGGKGPAAFGYGAPAMAVPDMAAPHVGGGWQAFGGKGYGGGCYGGGCGGCYGGGCGCGWPGAGGVGMGYGGPKGAPPASYGVMGYGVRPPGW